MARQIIPLADYIAPLSVNRLYGRVMHVPGAKTKKHRDILLLYDTFSTIELSSGLALALANYGHVMMPDMPGMGGMSSFDKIKLEPTLDTFADYVASLIKVTYRRKRFAIAGVGFGFVVATRMLQRYPDIAAKVDFVVSFEGPVHASDQKIHRYFNRFVSALLAKPWVSRILKATLLNKAALSLWYGIRQIADAEEKINRWQHSDLRTLYRAKVIMNTFDNCRKHVALPMYFVPASAYSTIDLNTIEQHARITFDDYAVYPTELSTSLQAAITKPGSARAIFTKALKRQLS